MIFLTIPYTILFLSKFPDILLFSPTSNCNISITYLLTCSFFAPIVCFRPSFALYNIPKNFALYQFPRNFPEISKEFQHLLTSAHFYCFISIKYLITSYFFSAIVYFQPPLTYYYISTNFV